MKRRRGSAGTLLLLVFASLFLILPVGSRLMSYLNAQRLILAAGQFVDTQLPQAYLCLDAEALAAGELEISTAAVDQFLHSRMAANLPAALAGKFDLLSIDLTWQSVPYDPAHWLGDRQPAEVPVVHCSIRVRPPGVPALVINRAAVLVLVPD